MLTYSLAREVLDRIKFKDWVFHLEEEGERLWVQVRYLEADVDGEPADLEIQHGRKWLVSRHATPSELVQTVFKAILTSTEHQTREHFTYRGARVFGPHSTSSSCTGSAARLSAPTRGPRCEPPEGHGRVHRRAAAGRGDAALQGAPGRQVRLLRPAI